MARNTAVVGQVEFSTHCYEREAHPRHTTGGMPVIRKDLLYSIWPYISLFRAGFKGVRFCLELAADRKWG